MQQSEERHSHESISNKETEEVVNEDSMGSTVTDEGRGGKLQCSTRMQRSEEEQGKLYSREGGGMRDVEQVVAMEAPSSSSSSSSSSRRRRSHHGEKTFNRKPWNSSRSNGYGHKSKKNRRQHVQNRVLELRNIVPCSTNCSIDSLLERTIKYIHFLQSTITIHNGNIDLQGGDYEECLQRYDHHDSRKEEENMAAAGATRALTCVGTDPQQL